MDYSKNSVSSTLFSETPTEPEVQPKKSKTKKKRARTSSSSSSSSSSTSTSSSSADIVSALDKAFAKPQPFANEAVNVPQPKATAKPEDAKVDNSERTLFFGNIPIETKANALKSMLREMLGDGCVESIRFRSVAVAGTKVKEGNNFKLYRKASAIKGKYKEGRATKNAYVVFKTDEFTEQALELNGHLFEDNHIRVDRAGDGARHKKDKQKKSVFLGNLPFNVEEEQIHQFFARGVSGGVESIVNVRVIRDRGSNMGIGIGYVEFADESYVSEAVALNGSQLAKRPVRVQRCHKSGALDKNRKATIGRSAKRQKMGGDRSSRGASGAASTGTETKGKKGKVKSNKNSSTNFRGAEAFVDDDVKKYKTKKSSKGHGQKSTGHGSKRKSKGSGK